MKKLLSILGTTSLIATSTVSLVACHSKPITDSKYFDTEINNIDPVVRNQVKYTSSIAKILIAARHENMNTYAYPTLQYFLNNMANNLAGTFATKSGESVKVRDYIEGYQKLNNLEVNPQTAKSNSDVDHYYDFNKNNNKYTIMNSMVETQNFDKWNKHQISMEDFELNPNTSWAQYDTGALANTLSQYSQGVNDYIQARQGWYNYYSDKTNPGISNLLIYNSLSSQPNEQYLSYVDKDHKETIKFGNKIARQSSALYNLFGTKYFNLAINGLTNFGRGFEMPTLYALTQIMPFANTDFENEEAFGFLLAIPLAIMTLQAKSHWFEYKTGKPKPNSPLLKVFSEKTLMETKVKFKDGTTSGEFSLYDILSKIKVMKYFTNPSKQYLDVTHPGHDNLFLRWYAILDSWFKKALAAEELAGKPVNKKSFNNIITNAMLEETNSLLNDPLYKEIINNMSDEATTLLRTVVEMLKYSDFDIYDLLRGFGSLANWIYQDTGEDFIPNEANVSHIEKVYNADNQLDGYQKKLSFVSPTSKYGELILREYGLESNNTSYKKNSFFDLLSTWAHGSFDTNSNSDADALHEFINNTISSKGGYLGKLINNIDQAMGDDWFDNIFLNKNWNITAAGKGIDGSTLGRVIKNGQLVGVRYQLDYYGSKDRSTDLNHHQEPLRYTNSVTGRAANWDKNHPKDRLDVPNMAPDDSWNKADWEAYDGLGNEYLKDSDQVKYSYVVEFDDEARMLERLIQKDDINVKAFKMCDFAWYYNNKRYY
ncbi:lipoprotein [Spiroplasma eriocheiris]|uniref:Lipoprotein n=1 Tax=Spiroplasma eriocheiris TaxID=315358 RepID=A0A0H3XKZ0_9MOLU|nr:lipoprotein [Spiroplasma eriocheiris]AHF57697.1 hypothetical protein SPE_0569 [Spiroplasma eriocheiris CCTCC M 207170]AKM54149.1 hypothetical protein SERIO_v1c05780 [Spiroplasma eriocheiris]